MMAWRPTTRIAASMQTRVPWRPRPRTLRPTSLRASHQNFYHASTVTLKMQPVEAPGEDKWRHATALLGHGSTSPPPPPRRSHGTRLPKPCVAAIDSVSPAPANAALPFDAAAPALTCWAVVSHVRARPLSLFAEPL